LSDKQIIKSLFQILDNINSKTESIERALTTIRNANKKIVKYLKVE